MSPEQEAAPVTTGPVTDAGGQGRTAASPGRLAEPGGPAPSPTCANCGHPVPDHFCGHCGQPLEHELHSVLHFGAEVAEDLTHADSRLWSTVIALLFKPGFLTREFIAGKRVRYLPPLRLYLVLSVVFFLVVGLHQEEPKAVVLKTGDHGTAAQWVSPDEVDELAARPGETPEQRLKRVCDPHYNGPFKRFVTPFLMKSCSSYVGDNGRRAAAEFIHTLPRAMFFFLPALALVMTPMYWHPRRYYMEHLVFFLHNHAFGFLVFALLLLVAHSAPAALGEWATLIVWLYLPYYLFVSMRRVYGQGRWRTFAKLVVLAFAYLAGGILTLALTSIYSVYSG